MRLIHAISYAVLASIFCREFSASAHDSDVPYAHWINSLMKPDFPLSSCCGVAEQYYVKEYRADHRKGIAFTATIVTHDGSSEFSIDVPEEKVIWNRPNPTGRGVIFIQDNDWVSQVVCFVPSHGA